MTRALLAITVLALGACGDDGDSAKQPDATPTIDAAVIDAPVADAGPMPKCRTVYLNFDAVTLVQGPDDAATNQSSVLIADQAVPAWRPTDPQRDAMIAQVVVQMTTRLGARGYDIVTTRPTGGSYQMIVFGGESMAVTGQAGFGSIAPQHCASMVATGIGFVFASAIDPDGTLPFMESNTAIALVGIMHSIPTSTGNREDCMCISATCAGWTGACIVGNESTIRGGGCGSAATFDEGLLFATPACL